MQKTQRRFLLQLSVRANHRDGSNDVRAGELLRTIRIESCCADEIPSSLPGESLAAYARAVRVAVVGHVEHITLAAVRALPRPGDIVHLDATRQFPGGGGGIAFYQLANGPTEVDFFTAIGNDDTGRFAVLAGLVPIENQLALSL